MLGIYKGHITELKNEKALLRTGATDDVVEAQFNNMKLPQKYTHGWKEFPKIDFIFIIED